MHPVILPLLNSITTDWVWLLIFTRFLYHTQRRTTDGTTPLNEWSVRRRDLYLTTHNNHNRQTSMPPRRAENFYLPLKIRRLQPGLNLRTWVPKASTLPLDHRSRYIKVLIWKAYTSLVRVVQNRIHCNEVTQCVCLLMQNSISKRNVVFGCLGLLSPTCVSRYTKDCIRKRG